MCTAHTQLQPAASHFIAQEWSAYTPSQHAVWRLLFQRRMQVLEDIACHEFLAGARAIGLEAAAIPDLALMNQRLQPLTGWSAVPVDGFLDAHLFFECLAQRRFPTTTIIRSMEQLEYLPEPDIFHDVFGHVPMHADPVFADFLQRFGLIAMRAKTESDRRALTRLFWFTVEFGLIREHGEVRIYGSGLISSVADCANALGPKCERRPFVLDDVLLQEFEIDHVQPLLFVIENTAQLFSAVSEAERRLERGIALA